ncbi:myosin-11 isoform X3 [Lingula anatina]|uniref:Myosin-11 isoform X3 n=1 Tax=Lingula anatina TaxID=7574 RepID=A0A1S3HDU0_LINAN|nr:myosin-11 isoform X3 [Lingula anatina]|eukprot:XP_013384222.1 myosin-11 isoform X3 [Lingula anatina]
MAEYDTSSDAETGTETDVDIQEFETNQRNQFDAMDACDADGEWSEGSEEEAAALSEPDSEHSEPVKSPKKNVSKKNKKQQQDSQEKKQQEQRQSKQNLGKSKELSYLGRNSPLRTRTQSLQSLQSTKLQPVLSSENKNKSLYRSVDDILDRIDTELLALTAVQTSFPSSTPLSNERKRLSKSEKDLLKCQGVEFDTADEVDVHPKLQDQQSFRTLSDKDGADTGLGSGSMMDSMISLSTEIDLHQPQQQQEQGDRLQDLQQQLEIVSEEEKQLQDGADEDQELDTTMKEEEQSESDDEEDQEFPKADSDLDSDTAQQIEEKFQAIMKKKRGGYLRGLKFTGSLSDVESVKTEDFEEEFQESMIHVVPLKTNFAARPVGKLHVYNTGGRKKSTDTDSIKTEDFERAFKKTVVKPADALPPKSVPKKKGQASDTESVRTEDFELQFTKALVKDALPKYLRPKSKQPKARYKPSSGSDVDSVKTEDFELNFKSLMVKQVAGVPLTSFDPTTIDSDIDTIHTQAVQEKFQQALGSSRFLTRSFEDSDVSDIDAGRPTIAVRENLSPGSSAHLPTVANKMDFIADVLSPEKKKSPFKRHERVGPHGIKTKTKINKTLEDDEEIDDDVAAEALEIERESLRIMHEMEVERKGQMISTPKTTHANRTRSPDISAITPKTSGKVFQARSNELKELTRSLHQTWDEKQALEQELKTVQDTLKKGRADVKHIEKLTKENRTKAEDVRSELMLAEFKRDKSIKELEHITEDLAKKRRKAKELEAKIDAMHDDLRNADTLSMPRDELSELLKEHVELKKKLREGHAAELERDELEKQLDATKEELFHEQKRAREKEEELEEEVEATKNQLEELQAAKENLDQQLEKLQNRFRDIDKEKNMVIKEKSAEYEHLRERMQNDMLELKKQTTVQLAELKELLKLEREKCNSLQEEINHKDELNLKLRDQVIELEQEMCQDTEIKDSVIEENQKVIKQLKKEKPGQLKEKLLADAKKAAEQDKLDALENQRKTLLAEHKDKSKQLEERLLQQVTDHKNALWAKDEELLMVRERLLQQEEATRKLGEKLRREAQDQIQNAIAKERENWDKEKERLLKRELSQLQEETSRVTSKLKDELENEKSQNSLLADKLEQLKDELEEEKRQAYQAYKDKLTAISQAKEEAKQEQQSKLEQVKDMFEREKMREVETLKETIKKQEEELRTLRLDRQMALQKERESSTHSERTEKTVIFEINEECRRAADLLGLTPRTVNLSSFKLENSMKTPNKSVNKNSVTYSSPSKSPTSAALANLRATNEELRNHVEELKQELDTLKSASSRSQHQQLEEIERLKQNLQREKEMELETLREGLIQEHMDEISQLQASLGKDNALRQLLSTKDKELQEIQHNMNAWKEETADKLARKFEEELNKELEKRLKDYKKMQRKNTEQQKQIDKLEEEVRRLSFSSTPSPSPGSKSPAFEDASTIRLLRHLQDKVKHLRNENTSLKLAGGSGSPSLSTSTPNLSNLSLSVHSGKTDDEYLKLLEQRARDAERAAEMAEERAQRNQHILTEKMTELSKMQETLAHQTKELMQMERAYSHLKQRSPSPTRSFRNSHTTR